MKKHIYLHMGDPNPKEQKISKHDLHILEDFARALSIKAFKKQSYTLDLKIIKEYPGDPSVVIEFPDDKNQEIYDSLRILEIVETIDSILPKD